MKKRVAWLFLVILLFTGCTQADPSQNDDLHIGGDKNPGLYLPDSVVEQHTNGAVRAYPLMGRGYVGIYAMKDNVVMLSKGERSSLEILHYDKGDILGSKIIDEDLLDTNAYLQITDSAVYYRDENGSVVYLDQRLRQTESVVLPEGVNGRVVVHPQTAEIYYCIMDEIRALDPDTGVSRLVRKQSCLSQQMQDVYFDGAVFSCEVKDQQGRMSVIYLSGDNGALLSSDQAIVSLDTYEDRYLALRKDGIVLQQIFGNKDEEETPLVFTVQDNLASALSLNGVVQHIEDEQGIKLEFYRLDSGKKTASVFLSGIYDPVSVISAGEYVWMLAYDNGAPVLYRWDIDMSLINDDTIYTGPLYTMETPDTEGLKKCKDRVSALNSKYGVNIRILQDAVSNSGNYNMEQEYQTEAIEYCLDELEQILAKFPENFLYKSVTKQIRICIVRSIAGGTIGAQYWKNADAYIVITAESNIRDTILYGIGNIVCTNILGNSSVIDDWSSLNPEGFSYGDTQNVQQYLTGSDIAFADIESTSSVAEDRSRLFVYALREGNDELFQSEIMQAKLLKLCKGIRDAWNWKKKTDVYIWEQYLTEPIAYKK